MTLQTEVAQPVRYVHYPLGVRMSFHRRNYGNGTGSRLDRTVLNEWAYPTQDGILLAVHELDEHVLYKTGCIERDLRSVGLSNKFVVLGYETRRYEEPFEKSSDGRTSSRSYTLSDLRLIENPAEQREIEKWIREESPWKELIKVTKMSIYFSTRDDIYK